jgi:polyisoprenyl-teichoic acid--peptidoglycan teichoic acid transferase
MECQKARQLMRAQGRGTLTAEESTLVQEHLATCPFCQAYRTTLNQQLLDRLLTSSADALPASSNPVPTPTTTPALPRSRHRLLLWLALSSILLLSGYLLGTIGWSLFTIRGNIQAMQFPTAVVRDTGNTGPLPTPALNVPTPAPTEVTARPPALATSSLTILLLGVDRRPGETAPSRTDAIAVARLDPVSGRVAILSLPRDLIVAIPGYGQGRINAASVYGELYPQLGGGAALTRNTVETLLNIPIDYTLEVDFNGFIGAINALGGINLFVEKEIYDGAYPTMDYGYQEVYFPVGEQHMDGENALIYSRVRHSDSDFERMRRQQQVLKAAINQVRDRNPLEQIQLIADVSTALRDHIRTDLSESMMASLAWTFRNISPEAVEVLTLDETMVAIGAPGDPYAQFALPGAIQALTTQLMNEGVSN